MGLKDLRFTDDQVRQITRDANNHEMTDEVRDSLTTYQQLVESAIEARTGPAYVEEAIQRHIQKPPKRFVMLFGINPNYTGPTTYDEDGLADSPYYVGEELTKEEIFSRLKDAGIVSKGLLGKLRTEFLLQTKVHSSGNHYSFKRVKSHSSGDRRYRLEIVFPRHSHD